jgi:hypothetical protein
VNRDAMYIERNGIWILRGDTSDDAPLNPSTPFGVISNHRGLAFTPSQPQLTIAREGPRHVRVGGWNGDEPFTLWAFDAYTTNGPVQATPLVTLRSSEALVQEVTDRARFYSAETSGSVR